MNIKLKAEGILRHMFHGSYRAAIILQFANGEDASSARKVLGDPWRQSEKRANILLWEGDSDELESCEDLLASFGADKKKISSIAKSIDYGEQFFVTIPCNVEDPNQLKIFDSV